MGTQLKATSEKDFITSAVNWVDGHRRTATTLAVAVAILGGGTWFWISAKARREAFAARDLESARATAAAGNLPLATNDISRVVERYGGTLAGGEAAIALAQIRLLQGQNELAIVGLRSLMAARPTKQFRGPALGLLAAALEQTDQPAEAARNYEAAADEYQYAFLKSQNLVDAGRAYWAAGDTVRAAKAYERVLADFKDTPGALEATVRLAELRRAAPRPEAGG